MKYLSGYTDPFISPVSGTIYSDEQLPDLERGYVWIGDKHNRPIQTYKLIDLDIDVRSLQKQIDNISESTFIVNIPQATLPNAQVLNQLEDGLMKNNSGFISIAVDKVDYLSPVLEKGKLWIGNSSNVATEQSTILVSNLPNLSSGKIWQGDKNNRPVEVKIAFAPQDATYIVQKSSASLPNAQALSDLRMRETFGDTMLKTDSSGKLWFAKPAASRLDLTADYITPSVLQEVSDYAVDVVQDKLKNIALDAGSNLFTILGVTTSSVMTFELANATFEKKLPSTPIFTKYKYNDVAGEDLPIAEISFDIHHSGKAGDFEPGLHLKSFDSSVTDPDKLWPLSIGFFGYEQTALGLHKFQKGFVFRSEMEINNKNSNYKFPKNFGLYRVSATSDIIGYNHIDPLFIYSHDSQTFNFYKNFNFLASSRIKGIQDPIEPYDAANKKYVDNIAAGSFHLTLSGAVKGSGSNAIKTQFEDNPVFTGQFMIVPNDKNRPTTLTAGMLRYNNSTQL